MKFNYCLVFIFLFMFVLVSAENIGDYKVDEPMEITNYCQAGDCTHITLISLELPNGTVIYPGANMTKIGQAYNYSYTPNQIGQYTFITCGDSTIAVCDSDTFDSSYSGEKTFVGVNIILLLFFISILLGVVFLNRKMDYEKWYKKILKKYEHKKCKD